MHVSSSGSCGNLRKAGPCVYHRFCISVDGRWGDVPANIAALRIVHGCSAQNVFATSKANIEAQLAHRRKVELYLRLPQDYRG
jgi:hypothetical protein